MKNCRKYIWAATIVILIFLIRVPFTYRNFARGSFGQTDKVQYCTNSYGDVMAAILEQQNRKVFVAGNFQETESRIFHKIITLFISLQICFTGFVLIINIREKIVQRNTIYFHGSKYKGRAFLS